MFEIVIKCTESFGEFTFITNGLENIVINMQIDTQTYVL